MVVQNTVLHCILHYLLVKFEKREIGWILCWRQLTPFHLVLAFSFLHMSRNKETFYDCFKAIYSCFNQILYSVLST